MKNIKRILYISTVEDGRPYQGVRKKINMQCKAFEKLGFEITLINSGRRTTYGQIEKIFPFSYGINYKIIKDELIKLEYDSYSYCYVRYSPASKGLIDVLKTIKETQHNIKTILEIPTFPYDNEFKSIKAKPSMLRERIYRSKMQKYVDLVVTPSHIETTSIFGIPSMEITNGIDLESIRARSPKQKDNNIINLIGVALLTPKQGYDRVIRGLSEYKNTKKEADPDVYFYVIGTGSSKKELEVLSTQLSVADLVRFPGEKEGNDLEYYYSIGDVGIGTLGLYKTKELLKVNSLKTREYCAKGLPFLITDCDYVFAESDEDFCLVVDDSEKPISIYEVIRFVKELNSLYPNKVIIERMTKFANDHLSWAKILNDVLEAV